MATIIRFCPFVSISEYIDVGDTIFAPAPAISPATLSVFLVHGYTYDKSYLAYELLEWFKTNEQNIAAVVYIHGYYYRSGVYMSDSIAATRAAPPPSAVPLGFGLGIYTSIDNFYGRWRQQYVAEDRYFAE